MSERRGSMSRVRGAAPSHRRARRLRGALAAAALLAAWAGPATAEELPEPAPPTTPVAAEDVPEDVVEWFLDAGSQVVTNQAIQLLGLSPEAAAAAELGMIRSVMVWSPSYIEATSLADPVVPAERWIAPVLSPVGADPEAGDDPDDDAVVEGTGDADGNGDDAGGVGDQGGGDTDRGGTDQVGERANADGEGDATDAEESVPAGDETDSYEFLGVLQAARGENGGVRLLQSFEPGVTPARDLAGLDSDAMLIFDEVLGAWFAIVDGEVQPVDAAARDSLAGSISLRDYQSFVAERHTAEGDTAAETGEPASAEPAIWTAGILGSLLLLTAAIVWLRKGD